MLSLFMKRACSIECLRVARLVGNVDHDENEFNRETQREFDKLLAVQGEEGMDVLDVVMLRERCSGQEHAHGMEGIGIDELVGHLSLVQVVE